MKTIFLVDDDGSMREMLSRHLAKQQYDVKTFDSPKAALPEVRSGHPNLVISDIQMPGMSGMEFAQAIRQAGNQVPIILISGVLCSEVVEEAKHVGVDHVLEKPIRDLSRLTILVHQSIVDSTGPELCVDLDRLRLDFLTTMSHELRTPLTAIKLALDGLFSASSEGMSPSHSRLVDISQRNLDRIIGVVENQLDLLQIALGDIAVVRRLVDIQQVVAAAVKISKSPAPRFVGLDSDNNGRHPILFSDPERLRAVIQYFLDSRAAGQRQSSGFSVHFHCGDGDIYIEFRNTDVAAATYERIGRDELDYATGLPQEDAEGVANFEYMACRRIVRSLGGRLHVRNNNGCESVHLRLPVLPVYDRRADFIVPLKNLRKAAMLSGKNLTVFKCRVGRRENDAVTPVSAEHEFLHCCLCALSDGDALVRGKTEGSYYLALLDRKQDEINHIVNFLENGSAVPIEAVLLHTLLPGESYPDDLLLDLEAVR